MNANAGDGLGSKLEILRRRKRVIILFFLLTVSAVLAGNYHMTPVYRATALLLIDLESPYVLATGSNAELGGKGYDSYNVYQEYFSSQMGIITSRLLLKPIFDEFDIAGFEDYKNKIDPFKKFRKTISVDPVRGTRYLEISVKNKNAKLAADLANKIAESYVTYNLHYISRNESLNLLKNEYLILKSKLTELSKVYKSKHPEIIRVQEEMSEIASEINMSKGLPSLDQKVKDSKWGILEGLKANNVSIIDPAIVPIKPYKPNYLTSLLLASFVGIFGGVFLCFFFEYQEAVVRNQEDVEDLTNWRFLIKLPRIFGFRKEMHVLRKQADYISECFKTLRTRIFFMESKGSAPKSIVLTSLGPAEGKTTLIANLAVTCAMMKKRVLLVDADMRKPRIGGVFRSKSEKGLGSYLAGKSEFDEVVQQTRIENLFIVSDTHSVKLSSELLSADRMKEFILQAEEKFDYVLYDTPPIGLLADAMILGSITDGLVIVVESGKTPRKAVIRNSKHLRESNTHVLGFILNRVSMSEKPDGYNYSYYYYSSKNVIDHT